MSRKLKAIPKEKVGKVCMKCLKNGIYINHIKIPMGGYESEFDNFQTQIDICDDCKAKHKNIFIGNKINHNFEKEVWEFVRSCPLEGRELFENRYGYGACAYKMEPQDWIDYKLNILPHDKCKEYGMYSYEEKQAYEDRFPVCDKVALKVHGDGSSGKWCPRGANSSLSSKCYMCQDFKLSNGDMKVVNVEDEFYKREIERTERTVKHFKDYLKKLKNREVDESDIY